MIWHRSRMPSIAVPRHTFPPVAGRTSPFVAAAAMLVFVAILRIPELGNPIAGLDDQFYLLVADRMWRGALPYVDIWDRKPIGLFLLYMPFTRFGDGILAYQIAASACLAATGWLVARIASETLPPWAGIVAGLAVIFYSALLGSGFGQAPIFYNLLTAIAALQVLRIRERGNVPGDLRRAGAAMALCGIALTLKTSAVFESCCFGLLLVAHDWRTLGKWRPVARRAAAYVAIGLAPTLAIAVFYAAIGAFDFFWFANFDSVFRRTGGMTAESVGRGIFFLLLLSPLILPALAEWRGIARERRMLLLGWALAGLLSFVAIGRCYDHYILPLLPPLALLAAHGLRHRIVAAGAGAALLLLAVQFASAGAVRNAYAKEDLVALAAMIPASVERDCLFVFEAPIILYHRTRACLPGRYVFPGHFTDETEFESLEKPAPEILRDALATRPAVIVMSPELREGKPPTPNDAILAAELRTHYSEIGRHTIRFYAGRHISLAVWRRRGSASPAGHRRTG